MDNPYRAQSKVNPGAELSGPAPWDRRIPTTTFRALVMAGLPGAQYQVLLQIIERTWGFNRDSQPISWTEFTTEAHVSRTSVREAIKKLEARQIIVVSHNRSEGTRNTYLFNPYWDTWLIDVALDGSVILKGSPEADTSAETRTSAEISTGGVQKSPPTSAEISTGGVQPSSVEPRPRKKPRKKGNKLLKERAAQLFELWNSLNIIQHSHLTDKRSRAVKRALEDHTIEELCQAVITYAKVLHGEEFFWSYRWTLEDFLNRGLEKFIDAEAALANYREDKGGQDGKERRRPEAHQRRDQAPTREEYLRSANKRPGTA